jgi:D-alanyl-D-alanine carboxypeptidase/D-alanyl-D-alanine-endopeptidase (penicillin-binding protein 4)
MLQKSDNLISEALLKTLGEKKYASNSFQSGITVVKEYLADLGLNTEDINLFDGSGLSRYNQVRAKIFNDFWLKSGHDGFVNKLSAPGSNGTLEHRFKGQSFREYLLAKTGSMLGISGITGILTNKKSKKLAVTIIANNVTDQKTAKLMEQELLDYIYHR